MDRITLKAASRLSGRMVAYQLKRLARNKLARRFPQAYAAYVERRAARVPELAATNSSGELARQVAAFYDQAYAPYMDDAAEGRFTYFGQTADFGEANLIDWHHTVDAEQDFHLWRQKLNHMGFICPMLIHGDDRHHSAVREALVGFRQRAGFDRPECFSSYWFPYSASHRILAILSGYLIAKETRILPQDLASEIEAFLRWNIGFVLANIEHELRNNHVERNLAALCFYYSHAETVPKRLSRRLETDVALVLQDVILDDGMLSERSAMYQGLSVMALQIFANTHFLSPGTRALAQDRLEHAIRAWQFISHPDGEIALFNDSWFGEVPRADCIVPAQDFAAVETLPDAGYGRLAGDRLFVLFDAGEIGPAWNPGHGHADFLSIEADVGGLRFVVDPGTYQYSTGPRRMYERSAAQHNGPAATGFEPVSYRGAFRVGRLAAAHFVTPDADAREALAGELLLGPGRVRREVRLVRDGVAITDRWTGSLPDPQVRLHISGAWSLLTHDENSAEFECEGVVAKIHVVQGHISDMKKGHWACRYLQDLDATILDLVPIREADGGHRLSWHIIDKNRLR